MNPLASSLLRYRADGSSFDKLSWDQALALIFNTSAYFVDPLDYAAHQREDVKADVGDRGTAPFENRVGVTADERDVLRYQNAPVSEILLGGDEVRHLGEDQRGGRSVFK